MADPRELYWANVLTGGGDYSLDIIDGADLADLHMAFVGTATMLYPYIVDADDGGSESSPDKIQPDSNPGNKMWELLGMTVASLTLRGNITVPADGVIGVTDGNPQIVFDNANNWLEMTGKVGIGTTTPQADTHIYSPTNVSLILGAQGTGAGQQALFYLQSLDDGSNKLGDATVKGWAIFARGNAYTIAAQQNDFGLSYWGGSSWITPFMIDSLTGDVDIKLHDASTVGFKLGGTLVTASAAELNIMDGVTTTTAEVNHLDGQTAQLILMNEIFS